MALTVAPDFSDGMLPASKLQQLSDAINERTPLAGLKTSDQNVGPSNTVLQDVTEVAIVVEANATYEFYLSLQYASNGTADIKIGFTAPAGATGDYGFMVFSTAAAWAVGRTTFAVGIAFDGASTFGYMSGSVTTGVNAGTVQLQAAQNTSTAVTTNVEAGTLLVARRVL